MYYVCAPMLRVKKTKTRSKPRSYVKSQRRQLPQMATSQSRPGGEQSGLTRSFEASVTEFEPQLSGGFRIDAAVASFVLKGEDKYTFTTSNTETSLVASQPGEAPTKLVAFAGIFDGHDGPAASEYCSKGLLLHVLAETAECAAKVDDSNGKNETAKQRQDELHKDLDRSVLKQGHISGFHRAEIRFAGGSEPPSFRELHQGVKKVRTNKTFIERWLCAPQRQRRGGTTACTLALYARFQGRDATPLHSAVIANTGDSRCITDDGGGDATFRQVTSDHRPSKPDEARRLKPFTARGDTYVERDAPGGTLRLYPGGLAVSRTIGDPALSHAAVATPDVFFTPLQYSSEKKRYRFVMASDGLWDVLETNDVGQFAAVHQTADVSTEDKDSADKDSADEVFVDPKEAAKRLMDSCIKNGGYDDDITILVVDVSLEGETVAT